MTAWHEEEERKGEREERVRVRKKKAPTFEELSVERAGGRGGIWRRYPRGFSLEIAFLPFYSQLLRKKTLTPTWGLGGGGVMLQQGPQHVCRLTITGLLLSQRRECCTRWLAKVEGIKFGEDGYEKRGVVSQL